MCATASQPAGRPVRTLAVAVLSVIALLAVASSPSPAWGQTGSVESTIRTAGTALGELMAGPHFDGAGWWVTVNHDGRRLRFEITTTTATEWLEQDARFRRDTVHGVTAWTHECGSPQPAADCDSAFTAWIVGGHTFVVASPFPHGSAAYQAEVDALWNAAATHLGVGGGQTVAASVTLEATLAGWASDTEVVVNPDGFGRLEVSGQVTDLGGGAGIAGVTVRATSGGTGSATSAADGTFQVVVSVPGGSQDTGLHSGVELQLRAVDGLRVQVDPDAFSEAGQSAQLVATLTDDTGGPRPGVDVTLTPVDPSGPVETVTTGADGTAGFTVTHDDPARSEYRFAVSTADAEREELTIPVGGAVLETNPATGAPLLGVAADGRSTVDVELVLPSANVIALASTPALGTLTVDGDALPPEGTIDLAAGRATVTYTPPAYLSDDQLNERVTVTRPDGTTVEAFAARQELAFGYDDADGQRLSARTEVLLVRAPVMLVHGFTGDLTTWAAFEQFLHTARFDAVNGDYIAYTGGLENTSIQYQSNKLRDNIAGQRQAYAAAGIRLERVDVVAHSMGGLITRHYAEEMADYAGDVRKIIMAGTPNHGAGPLDQRIGSLASIAYGGHQVAGQQLYRGSEFLQVLNAGEATGAHLNAEVQYANLIGRRSTNYAAYLGIPYANDDGVVTVASASLNGVRSWIFDGIKHSSAAFLYGDASITDAYEIYAQIVTLLGADIPAGMLAGERLELVAASGTVGIRSSWQATTTPVPPVPVTLQRGDRVQTGPDGSAVVHLFLGATHWGTLDVAPSTDVAITQASPQHVVVRLVDGQARITSAHPDRGVFDVLVGPDDTGPDDWAEAYPSARVTDRDTSFVVAAASPTVWSLDGGVVMQGPDGSVEGADTGGALTLAADGTVAAGPAITDRWWEDGAYAVAASSGPSIVQVVAWGTAGLLGLIAVLLLVVGALQRRGVAVAVGAVALVAAAGAGVVAIVQDDPEVAVPTADGLALPATTVLGVAAPDGPTATPTPSPVPTPTPPPTTPTPPPTTPTPTPSSTPTASAATASCNTTFGMTLVYAASWSVWDDEDPEFDCSLFDVNPMPTFAEADLASVIVAPDHGLTFEESVALWEDPYWTMLSVRDETVGGHRARRMEVVTTEDPDGDRSLVWVVEATPTMSVYVRDWGPESYDAAATFADDLVLTSDWG